MYVKSKIITVDSKTHGLKSIQFKRQIENLVKQGVTTPIIIFQLSWSCETNNGDYMLITIIYTSIRTFE